MIANVVAEIVNDRFTDLVCTGFPESVTVNVSAVALAVAVGVPAIAPVEAFSARPVGSVPDVSVQIYGVAPPVATSVALYAVPTWPFGSEVVVIANVTGGVVTVLLLEPPQPVSAHKLESRTIPMT